MKKISLPLGAIDRNKYSGASHAFNLRLKDGAIRNVGKPTETSVGNNVDYIHTSAGVNEYRNLLQINNGDTTTVYYVGNLNTGETFSPPQEFRINAHTNEVRHIGNTLIFLTDDGMYYALFKNGEYSLLGKKPPEPKIRFKVEKGSVSNIPDGNASAIANYLYDGILFAQGEKIKKDDIFKTLYQAGQNVETSREEIIQKFTDHFTGSYNKAVNSLIDNGLLPKHPVFLRYAVKLYDGSYIYQSPPLLIADNNGKEKSFVYHPCGLAYLYNPSHFIVPFKSGSDLKKLNTPFALPYKDVWPLDGNSRDVYRQALKNVVAANVGQPGDPAWKPGSIRYDWIDSQLNLDEMYISRWVFNDALGVLDTVTIADKYFYGTNLAIKCQALSFVFENIPDYNEWKDVISSVDIFISKPQTPYKLGEKIKFPNAEGLSYQNPNDLSGQSNPISESWANTALANKWSAQEYTDEEIFDSVASESAFFLLKSIPFEKINDYNKNTFYSLAEEIKKYMHAIEQQRTLPDDNYSRNDYIPQTSLVLNQSLHIGDIKTRLFKGFAPDDYAYYIDDHALAFHYNKGYSKYLTDESNGYGVSSAVFNTQTGTRRVLSPMIFVPISNATNIEIRMVYNTTEHTFNFRLNNHKALNGTYYLNEKLEHPAFDSWRTIDEETYTLPEDKVITKTEHNLVMVSEGSNPFFFDFKQTNYVGTSRIVAMAAATTALSSGQFGRFPLYVFTADGVYSLYMNDEGKYVSAHSVSADILLDKHKLCPITSAVVFATRQGLKALNGSQSTLLSAQLDGHAHDYSADDRPYHNPQLQAFLNGYQVSDFIDYLSAETTEVHYSYPYDEVWVVDTQKNYAYIYDLRSRAWMCRDTADMSNIRAFKILDDYPNLYLHHNNKLYDVATESQTEMLPFLYISNPQGGLDFIKYNNFLLGDYLAGCNLVDFKIFAGNNPFRVCKALSAYYFGPKHEFTGIHLNRIPSSVRYVQFAVKGHADDVCLSALNADISGNNYENTK